MGRDVPCVDGSELAIALVGAAICSVCSCGLT
jgi:hypothetical protein